MRRSEQGIMGLLEALGLRHRFEDLVEPSQFSGFDSSHRSDSEIQVDSGLNPVVNHPVVPFGSRHSSLS